MKILKTNEMENVVGGVTKEEYCDTLGDLLTGGGYQGDKLWGYTAWLNNCG